MKYTHPSIESRIIDNSFVTIQEGTGGTTLFTPFVSDKGPDNQMLRYSSKEAFLRDFGKPNINRHGQAIYNVINWLGTGQGAAYVVRVLPPNARYATVAFTFKLTDDKVIPVFKPLEENNNSEKSAETYLMTAPEDEARLAVFLPKGRGEGYNGLGVKVDLYTALDATFDFRTHRITFFQKDATGADQVLEGPYIVSFYPNATNLAGESLYFKDVINKYSENIRVLANDDAFEKIATHVTADTEVDPRSVDIIALTPSSVESKRKETELLFTAVSTNEEDPNYSEEATDLTRVVYFGNGSNGTARDDDKNVDIEDENVFNSPKLRNSLYIQTFRGELTDANGDMVREVTATDGTYIDVVLDANFSVACKNEASQYCVTRGDCVFIADTGLDTWGFNATKKFRDVFSVSTYMTAIFAQQGQVFDSYSGAKMKATSTYILASKIPTNDANFGVQYPFVGPRRGVISGFEDIDFYPDEDQKNQLYTRQINYIERDPKKVNFASQVTSQVMNSSLSDLSHVRVLLLIKRNIEAIARNYRLEFNDTNTHNLMSAEMNNYLAQWTANGACTQCSAAVSATEYEKTQRIASVYVDIVFTGILERIQLNFTVGA